MISSSKSRYTTAFCSVIVLPHISRRLARVITPCSVIAPHCSRTTVPRLQRGIGGAMKWRVMSPVVSPRFKGRYQAGAGTPTRGQQVARVRASPPHWGLRQGRGEEQVPGTPRQKALWWGSTL